MPRLRLAWALLIALMIVVLQAPLSALALPSTGDALTAVDVAGPVFSGLKANGVVVSEDGVVALSHANWQRAGRSVRIAGVVRDPAGIRSATLTLTSPENVVSGSVRLSVGWNGSFTALQRLPAAGTWTVNLTSTDRKDNASTLSFVIDVLPDTEAPTLLVSTFGGKPVPADGTISLLPSVWATNKSPELRGRVTDLSGIESLTITTTAPDSTVSTMPMPFGTSTGSFLLRPNLTVMGTWSFEIEARDKAGNTASKTLTVTIEEDRTGPVFAGLQVNRVPISVTNTVDVSHTYWLHMGKRIGLTGRVSDPGAGLKTARVTLTSPDGTVGNPIPLRVYSTGSFSAQLFLPSTGTWTMTLGAEDKLGNPTTQSLTVEVLPDTEGPLLRLGTLGNMSIPSGLTVNLSGAAWLANKTPELRGRVTDFAGIEGLIVDITAPDSTTSTATIPVSGTGAFSYRLNLTTPGTWEYAFEAADKAGNTTTVILSVTVLGDQNDQVAPALSLKVNDADVAANTVVTLSNADWIAAKKFVSVWVQATDAGAGMESVKWDVIRPDGTSWSYTFPSIYSDFTMYVHLPVTGTWSLALTAKDQAGNSTTVPFTIEVQP